MTVLPGIPAKNNWTPVWPFRKTRLFHSDILKPHQKLFNELVLSKDKKQPPSQAKIFAGIIIAHVCLSDTIIYKTDTCSAGKGGGINAVKTNAAGSGIKMMSVP